MSRPLTRWNEISGFLRILAHTGFAANGRPQSCFLLSDPGHGKTELLERFNMNVNLDFWSDVTYGTIIKVGKKALRAPITHIVCTEFQKVINRRPAVAESTLAILLQAMEEGLGKVGFGPQVHDLKGVRFGIFAGTTVRSIEKRPAMITELALDSRAFFVDARGTTKEIQEIERRIAHGDISALKKIMIAIPPEPITVKIPISLAEKVRGWVREMENKGCRVYGVRTYSRFLHTLRGVALMHKRDVVRSSDLDELYRYRNMWLKPPPLPDEDNTQTGHRDND